MASRDRTRQAPRAGIEAPVAPRPLPAQIADYLRERIFHDVLKPGERIREQAVADSLAVSRTPLRDALRILETEGLVKIHPNRGATIVALDDAAASGARQVQATLEALAGSLLAAHFSEDIETALGRHLDRLRKAAARGDRAQWFRTAEDLFNDIVRLSQNSTIIDLHHKVSTVVYRSRYIESISAHAPELDTGVVDGIVASMKSVLPQETRKRIIEARS